LSINPNFAEAYLNRGSCLEMQRKFNEAIADWKKAYELGITKAKNYISFYE
jgi:tetratricopeptide (TPR) repeat protein